MPRSRSAAAWTFAITSIALFMVALDNLVVTTALPVIKQDLGASLADLQWMVNAYTLTFAVLLITGAALGDRFGRQRVFVIGLGIFIGGSALAALSPSSDVLILARAIQGVGGAIVTPLTLTILSAAVPPERRAVALGAWGGIAGLAIAIGPLVGGAIAEGLDWHWIFWLNVPIGLVLMPLAALRLNESRGPDGRLDIPGLGLVSGGLLALVWGVINGNDLGWESQQVVAAIGAGVLLLLGFVAWEARNRHAMLPLSFFRSRAFSASNAVSLLMYFGMFGSVFLLAQFFQVVQGYSPFQAGLRTLPWTGMPVIVAPIAGILADRIGGRPILAAGMALQAVALGWLAAVVTPTIAYEAMVVPFILAGIGMGLFFAPIANVVLSAVRPDQEGKASGATNTIREVGGVFGVAVLAAIFSANGDYSTPAAYVAGLQPAIAVGAVVLGIGALAALAIPARAGARVIPARVDGQASAPATVGEPA
jgi:EmrB/QacA subfamily drug resistance transporter